MAFDPNGLSDVAALNRGRTLFEYGTRDPLATVLAAGYFDAAHGLLTTGDSILVSADDGEAIVRAAIVNGGAVVAVSQGGAGTANLSITANELGPGTVERTLADVLTDLTQRERRGAYQIDKFSATGSVAGGTVDARAAFAAAFASGEHIILQPATYKWSDIIDAGSLSNVTISGVPGITKITGDFGPRMLLLDDLTNVEFNGIIFENTNAQVSADAAYGTVYSYRSIWSDVRFKNCGFTAPNGNLNGLMVYVRTTPTDATNNAAIDGLLIEGCDFHDIGRIGCMIMCRWGGGEGLLQNNASSAQSIITLPSWFSETDDTYNGLTLKILSGAGRGQTFTIADYTGSNKQVTISGTVGTSLDTTSYFEIGPGRHGYVRNVKVKNNKFRNLGLSGTSGIGLSLDGYGEGFEVSGNSLRNCLTVGIENVGWIKGAIRENNFADFRSGRAWAPLSLSTNTNLMYKLLLQGNKCLEAANATIAMYGVMDSLLQDEYYWSDSLTYTLRSRYFQRNTLRECYIRGSGTNQIAWARENETGRPVQDNIDEGCTFDHSESTNNSSVVRAAGSAVLRNITRDATILNVTGVAHDETSSARLNRLERTNWGSNLSVAPGTYRNGMYIYSMSDADVSPTSLHAQHEDIKITGTLTATRTLTWPKWDKKWTFWNATSQTVNVKSSGSSSSVAIAAGSRIRVAMDLTNNELVAMQTATS